MKKKYLYLIPLLIFSFAMPGCDESDFLKEKPLDFLSTETAFVEFSDFESGLVDLYAKVRHIKYAGGGFSLAQYLGTDLFDNARNDASVDRFGNYTTVLNSTGEHTRFQWSRWYKIISSSNTLIARVAESKLTADQKLLIEAEARLFRAFSYRHLVYLYGDVPLYTYEITSPKTDFTRAPVASVFTQIIEDAVFAAANLPSINEVKDGRVSNLVAQHLLAETYISTAEYDNAIAAATVVIDDPNMALMTTRFGSAVSSSGDVYYDLFKSNNQNRSSGNKEAIWVAQMETDVLGGLNVSSATTGVLLERYHSPVSYLSNDPDGKSGFLGPRSDLNIGGRGVSFMKPTNHFTNTIWASDFNNDIRNSQYNFVRTLVYDNPASAYFGQSALQFPGSIQLSSDWRFYPHLSKVTTPGKHPTTLVIDQSRGLLSGAAGTTYLDQYIIRLAETYLLRAEAYLAKGLTTEAAADINIVRARSNASPVSPGAVTIDYILDERARELSLEEDRRITLHRTGKLVERVRLYNDLNGPQIQDFHSKWPIPRTEIEANVNAKLEQNQGYN